MKMEELKETKLPIDLKSENGRIITVFRKVETNIGEYFQVVMKDSPYPFLLSENEMFALLQGYPEVVK